ESCGRARTSSVRLESRCGVKLAVGPCPRTASEAAEGQRAGHADPSAPRTSRLLISRLPDGPDSDEGQSNSISTDQAATDGNVFNNSASPAQLWTRDVTPSRGGKLP